tara:strand:+ start:1599 stop:1910 length:312 start_codon:yes stop_codon:yes gene_type:complete
MMLLMSSVGGCLLHDLADVAKTTASLGVSSLAVVETFFALRFDGRPNCGLVIFFDIGFDGGDGVFEAETHQAILISTLMKGDTTCLAQIHHLIASKVYDPTGL